MHVYEVIPGIYKFFFLNFFFQNLKHCTGFFRKQQNETGYFCGMTLLPDGSSDPILIGDVILSMKSVSFLLIKLNTYVPCIIAVNPNLEQIVVALSRV